MGDEPGIPAWGTPASARHSLPLFGAAVVELVGRRRISGGGYEFRGTDGSPLGALTHQAGSDNWLMPRSTGHFFTLYVGHLLIATVVRPAESRYPFRFAVNDAQGRRVGDILQDPELGGFALRSAEPTVLMTGDPALRELTTAAGARVGEVTRAAGRGPARFTVRADREVAGAARLLVLLAPVCAHDVRGERPSRRGG